jgi:hypothetical protein
MAATADLQRAEALAAYGAKLLEPVVAELAAARREVAARSEDVGRLREQLQVAVARIAELETPAPREESPLDRVADSATLSTRPWWVALLWWRR